MGFYKEAGEVESVHAFKWGREREGGSIWSRGTKERRRGEGGNGLLAADGGWGGVFKEKCF